MSKILLIVPDLGLSISNEIEWITRSFHTETLNGHVTPSDVFEHVTGRSFDIIHFGSHGDENGIQLSSNTYLDMFQIERLSRTVGANLLYLNSCSSARLAQFAVDQGVPAVIASTHRLEDSIAWSVATSFYQALQRDDDFYRAFETAKPRDGTLAFFSNGHLVSRQVLPLMNQLEKMRKWFLYSQLGLWIIVIGELVAIMILAGG